MAGLININHILYLFFKFSHYKVCLQSNMATYFEAKLKWKPKFITSLEKYSGEIENNFTELFDALEKRKGELITSINTLKLNFLKNNSNHIKEMDNILDIEQGNLKSSSNDVLEKKEDIERLLNAKKYSIHCEWDVSSLMSKFEILGEFKILTLNTAEYQTLGPRSSSEPQFSPALKQKNLAVNRWKSSDHPTNSPDHKTTMTDDNFNNENVYYEVSDCNRSMSQRGKDKKDLLSPQGVCISQRDNLIYIADQENNRVQVFDNGGNFKFTFGTSGPGTMSNPHGILAYDKLIYVSQRSGHTINAYKKKNGQFVMKKGKKGNEEGQFDHPEGICISGGNALYVCDTNNHRIQLLNLELNYTGQFGKGNLYKPHDIKIIETFREVAILDEQDPCVHIVNYRGELNREIISNGVNKDVLQPSFIYIDDKCNFYISDSGSDRDTVLMYAIDGKYIGEVGNATILGLKNMFHEPKGIAKFNDGKLIVVCNNELGCIKIF